MADTITYIHERVDDIPLIIGLAQQLGLPELLDRHLESHGNHQGLSNGSLIVIWLAYNLSAGDHCKSKVEDWANRRRQTLEKLLGQPIRPGELNDDRLGIALRYLSNDAAWEALEAALWLSTYAIYHIPLSSVRLDSTTGKGYHTQSAGGLMQPGHSKDHRPDLPQFKLMAAAAEPVGHLLATTVYSGEKADDPLYVPMLARVRGMLGQTGLLYSGDCKMAALATRADIVAHLDFYRLPLPLTGETAEQFPVWIAAVVAGDQSAQLIWRDDQLIGGGYAFDRQLTALVDGQTIAWTERVLLVRSSKLAAAAERRLFKHLTEAEAELLKLTPPPGRGKHQYRDEAELKPAVAGVLTQHNLTGLLQVGWQRAETVVTRYVGRGRSGANRAQRTEIKVRYVITAVTRDEAAIRARSHRLGWRVYVTSMPGERMPFEAVVLHYRGGCCLERNFHLLKDRPLGISEIYVRNDDQIKGLNHLLTLGLRLLTLIETQVRAGLKKDGQKMTGLYESDPNRATDQPSATRILRTVARAEITLSHLTDDGQSRWLLSSLPKVLDLLLGYLKLPESLYTQLIGNST